VLITPEYLKLLVTELEASVDKIKWISFCKNVCAFAVVIDEGDTAADWYRTRIILSYS
jgi:hypothetical protein